MACQTRRIHEASLYVLRFKPWISHENSGWIISSRKHVEHMFDGQPSATNNRLSAEDFRIAGDSIDELFVIHMHYNAA